MNQSESLKELHEALTQALRDAIKMGAPAATLEVARKHLRDNGINEDGKRKGTLTSKLAAELPHADPEAQAASAAFGQ